MTPQQNSGMHQEPPTSTAPNLDPVEQALTQWQPLHQLAIGAGLALLGILLVRTVSRRFEHVVPLPAPPTDRPPPLAALPAHWPPLSRLLAWVALRLGFGPPRSFKPVLLPLAVLVWLAVQPLAARIAGVEALEPGTAWTAATMAAIGRAQLLIAAAVLAFFLLWTRLFGDGLADVGLRRDRLGATLVFAGVTYVAFLPLQFGAIAIESGVRGLLGSAPDPQAMVEAFAQGPDAQRNRVVWLGLALAAPLHEELLFRGMLLRFLGRIARPAIAVTLNGLLFALPHDGGRVAVFALGVGLAWLMQRTGNLAAPLLFHVMHNGLTLATLAALG